MFADNAKTHERSVKQQGPRNTTKGPRQDAAVLGQMSYEIQHWKMQSLEDGKEIKPTRQCVLCQGK